MNIKAVIFDMDGVIIDSEPLHSLSWEILLNEYKIKPILNNQGLIHDVGPVGDDTYRVIMEKHHLKEDLEIIKIKRRKIFEDLIKTKAAPMPGFLNLIKKLKKEKIKIAVASNRILEHLYLMLNKLQVKDFFEVVVGRSSNRKPKPSPDIFLETAKELKVKPSGCIVLEDSETGVIAAEKAEMKVIAVPTKLTKHHDFSKADKIINSLNDITIKFLQSL